MGVIGHLSTDRMMWKLQEDNYTAYLHMDKIGRDRNSSCICTANKYFVDAVYSLWSKLQVKVVRLTLR